MFGYFRSVRRPMPAEPIRFLEQCVCGAEFSYIAPTLTAALVLHQDLPKFQERHASCYRPDDPEESVGFKCKG